MTTRQSFRTWVFRILMNLWPCIWATGVRITFLSADFRLLRMRIPLNWLTRNRVGTIFGGSLYGATDPIFFIQLMEILGRDFVVWDKAAAIRFKRPGRETLYAEFHVTAEQSDAVKRQVEQAGETTFTWTVALRDKAGVVHAEVDKTMYVATKAHFRRKEAERANRSSQAS